jgi:uncharacterized protein (DUF1501 family)
MKETEMNIPRGVSRRKFLIGGGGLLAAGALGGGTWAWSRDDGTSSTGAASPATSSSTSSSTSPATSGGDHVLVVVQLSGGNDALNTLVPLDGRYHDARPSLGVADEGLVALPGLTNYGLHPSFASWKDLLAAGQVAALAGIGFEHPDRSHFVALADWWAGAGDRQGSAGWLGRYLDATSSGHDAPLRAVALGGGSPALTAERSVATVVNEVSGFVLRAPRAADRSSLVQAWKGLAPAHAAAGDAVDTFQHLDVGGRGASDDVAVAKGGGGREGELAGLLAVAAALVRDEPAVRVVQVMGGGFDTHAAQADTQARLLADLADGVAGFFTTLAQAGHAGRVMLVTVSEFGRRVAENGSGGTDHGKAGVQFVVGPAVKGGVYGQYDLGSLDDGDLPPRVDPGSLYTLALDWLGAPAEEILGRRFDTLGVV